MKQTIAEFFKGLNVPTQKKITKEEFEATIIGYVKEAYQAGYNDALKQAREELFKEIPVITGSFENADIEYATKSMLSGIKVSIDRVFTKLMK